MICLWSPPLLNKPRKQQITHIVSGIFSLKQRYTHAQNYQTKWPILYKSFQIFDNKNPSVQHFTKNMEWLQDHLNKKFLNNVKIKLLDEYNDIIINCNNQYCRQCHNNWCQDTSYKLNTHTEWTNENFKHKHIHYREEYIV